MKNFFIWKWGICDFIKIIRTGVELRKDESLEQAFDTCDAVLTINSNIGFEALKKEKNTINQLNLIYNLKPKGSHKKANKKLEKLNLDKPNLSDAENEIIQDIIAKLN